MQLAEYGGRPSSGHGRLMIRTKIAELRRKKEYEENRDLTLRTIAEETGLALGTVQRLMKGDTERVYLSTLNTLCDYFGVQDIGELIEYIRDPKPPVQS